LYSSTELFAKNNPVPSSKVVTLHRSSPFDVFVNYADASLLPPGIGTQIASFSVSDVKASESIKIRLKVKLDINSLFVVEGVEQVETIEEQEAPATPSQAEVPQTPEQKSEEPTPMQDATPTSPPPSTPPTTPAEGEKEKKKKVRRTNLPFKESTSSIPQKELQNLIEEESKMVASDKLAFETAEKKNAVESYCYDMRNKINDSLHEFSTEQERNALSAAFEATESWLYGEGEDTTKSAYAKKLDELKALGDPIVKRKHENENRYEALNNIKSAIEQWRMTASSADPKYDHIPKEERDKVAQEVNNTEKWVTEQMMKQDRVPKHANPVVLVADITKKQNVSALITVYLTTFRTW
jgi:heat shock protein 4